MLTFRRAEAVAKLLKPRVRSLESVADVEKFLDAAHKAPPPAPGALPAHLSGSRVRKAGDIALLQYTSGSTGDPKGVTLTHANLLANIRAMGEAVQLTREDVGISWLPLYHDMGLIGAWLTLLYFGTPLCVMSPLAFLTRPARWLQAFHKHRGTITAAPNFAYELCVRKIADEEIQGLDLSSWRAALNGAEPVNPETLERFEKRFAKYGFRREAQLPIGIREGFQQEVNRTRTRNPRNHRGYIPPHDGIFVLVTEEVSEGFQRGFAVAHQEIPCVLPEARMAQEGDQDGHKHVVGIRKLPDAAERFLRHFSIRSVGSLRSRDLPQALHMLRLKKASPNGQGG